MDKFQALKQHKTFKYIIFTLSKDLTEIVVDKAVDKSAESVEYDKFLADIPETECRWAVYDFEFEKEGAGKRNKIVFISW